MTGISESSRFRDNPPSYDEVLNESVDTKPDSPAIHPSAPSDVTESTSESARPKSQKKCFVAILIIAVIGIIGASLFSYFQLKDPVSNKDENVTKTIFDCNVENACGDHDNMAAACIKIDTDQGESGYWRNQGVTEVEYDSWINIEEAGYWCMPCCISNINKNVEMFLCESLFPKDTVLQRNSTFGRCGIDYNL